MSDASHTTLREQVIQAMLEPDPAYAVLAVFSEHVKDAYRAGYGAGTLKAQERERVLREQLLELPSEAEGEDDSVLLSDVLAVLDA